jgi:membrane carboxypeptidase/penicillin-binding protein
MNEIYLGAGAYGVAVRAQTYGAKALNSRLLTAPISPRCPRRRAFIRSNSPTRRRPPQSVIDRIVENGYHR